MEEDEGKRGEWKRIDEMEEKKMNRKEHSWSSRPFYKLVAGDEIGRGYSRDPELDSCSPADVGLPGI